MGGVPRSRTARRRRFWCPRIREVGVSHIRYDSGEPTRPRRPITYRAAQMFRSRTPTGDGLRLVGPPGPLEARTATAIMEALHALSFICVLEIIATDTAVEVR